MPIVYNQSDFFDLVEGRSDEGFDPEPPEYKILVEGDSWVSHPLLRNLSHQLDILGGDKYGLLNLAVPGDTAANMFKRKGKQLKQIGQLISSQAHGYEFDLIFVSAAGNDIVGQELLDFVDKHNTDGKTGPDLLNDKFDKAVDTAVKGYENLIKLRDRYKANKSTPIVTQTYCYVEPRQVGTKFFGKSFGKGWIKQYLEIKEVPKSDQAKIVVAMLSRFHDRLVELQDKYSGFYVVDTRKTLMKSGKPNVAMFYDEIHPTNEGFRKVALKIKQRMANEGIWLG